MYLLLRWIFESWAINDRLLQFQDFVKKNKKKNDTIEYPHIMPFLQRMKLLETNE